MKTVWIIFLFAAGLVAAEAPPIQSPYPNELPGFKFWEQARWKPLVPLVSSMQDVRTLLGEPVKAIDGANYFADYPGDDKALAPLFIYDADAEWQIFFYFVKTDGRKTYPENLYDRVLNIDLIPKKRVSFTNIEFPPAFKTNRVAGADAAWHEYSDGSGLVYKVYYSKSRSHQPGDLFRISYRPSDAAEMKNAKTRAEPKAPADGAAVQH